MDPQLPSLGQHIGNRNFRITDEAISFSFEGPSRVVRGQMYVIFGSTVPVWNYDMSKWELPLPKQSKTTGCVRVLGMEMSADEFRLAELCCGYMGGWSSATDVLPNWTVGVALDISESAVANYKLNHSGTVLKDMGGIADADPSQCLILCHDLCDFDWLEVFNYKDINCFSLSTPCQSWSSLGSGSGSDSANGQVLVAAVQAVRLTQPVMVLMEQVFGFRRHSEYDDFLQAMQQSGYRLAQAGVHDLEVLSHTTRKRWLGIFINTAHISRWDQLGKFLSALVKEPHAFKPEAHCFAFLTPEQLNAVRIQHAEELLLDDPKLLPPWKRQAPQNKCSAMASRVIGAGGTFPTITASHRKVPGFQRQLLEEKGLMSWLIRDSHQNVRWCSKFEAAHALGFKQGTVLPVDEAEGFLAVGNSISPFHAALTMVHATDVVVTQTGQGERLVFEEVLGALRDLQGHISEQTIEALGSLHEVLGSRLPNEGHGIRCPHCGRVTRQPLVQACRECALIACVDCVTDVCEASHYASRERDHDNELRTADQGKQQFSVVHAQSGAVIIMSVNEKMTIGGYIAQHRLPSSIRFFVRDAEVNDAYVPQHNDEVWQVDMEHWTNRCPMCLAEDAAWTLRFCNNCKRVGCNICVSEICGRCTAGKRVCNHCHQRLAEDKYRPFQESMEQCWDLGANPAVWHRGTVATSGCSYGSLWKDHHSEGNVCR